MGNATLLDSTIVGNSSLADNGRGYAGTGVVGFGSSGTASNVTVTGNQSDSNGAFGTLASNISITDSIVTGNVVRQAGRADDVSRNAVANSLIGVDVRSVFAVTTEVAPGVFAGVLGGRASGLLAVALKADALNPAIDAAGPGASAIDQRGATRLDIFPGGGTADLGAVELRNLTQPVLLSCGAGDDAVGGTIFRDSILGGAGSDTLRGFAGADTLDGGAGRDEMAGGTGNDTYVLRDPTDVATELRGEGTLQHLARLRVARVVDEHRQARGLGRDRQHGADDVRRRHAAGRCGEAEVPECGQPAGADQRRGLARGHHVELADGDGGAGGEALRHGERQRRVGASEPRKGHGGVDRQDRAVAAGVHIAAVVLLERGVDAEALPQAEAGAVQPQRDVHLAAPGDAGPAPLDSSPCPNWEMSAPSRTPAAAAES
jgi:hypothetical protein